MSAPIVLIARDSHRAGLLAFLGWSGFVLAVAVMAPAPLAALAIVWATPTAAAAAFDAADGRLPDNVVLPGATAVLAMAVPADRWATALMGAANIDMDPTPSMASEDFAFMLQAKPGCYIWLGGGRGPDTPNLHNPQYDFNDDSLQVGASYWVTLAVQQLPAAATVRRAA